METAKSLSRLSGGSYQKPLGIPCPGCARARAFPPYAASPSSRDQKRRVWAQRPGPGGSADSGAPRAAPTITCPRCQAGERPPPPPLAPLPAANTRPEFLLAVFRAVMCRRGWRPAGPGALPSLPTWHTSDSEECVCVCAFDSFKGKKLSLGRIPPGTLAAGCRGGILGPGGPLQGPLSPQPCPSTP